MRWSAGAGFLAAAAVIVACRSPSPAAAADAGDAAADAPTARAVPPLDEIRAPAAAEDDEATFARLLSTMLPERKLLSAREAEHYCDKYVDFPPAQLRMCILTHLLPESPREVACSGVRRATCRVVGASPADVRTVELALEAGIWKIVRSKKAQP